MKHIQLFKRKEAYEDFVFNEIFKADRIKYHPFYQNLIQFVLDAKAPVFYEQTDASEYANFSAYYNWVLRRAGYANPTMESMYFLHDFAHMMFDYPYDMTSVSEDEFNETVITNEYAASNETEIFAHFRVPGLRESVLQDRRIFFDTLKDMGIKQPTVHELLGMRRLLIETGTLDFLFPKPEDAPVIAQLKSYRGNRAWCKTRFKQVVDLNPTEYFFWSLRPFNYERVLMNYQSTSTQENYERTVLKTVRIMCAVMSLETLPRYFDECFELIGNLEGRAMLKSGE
jgi:hypothetical protein